MKKPFFARYLTTHEMERIGGGDKGGIPNGNSCKKGVSKHCPRLVTLKAGKCGNDCDPPDGGIFKL